MFKAPTLGLDCSFCCWVAWPRLTEKECIFIHRYEMGCGRADINDIKITMIAIMLILLLLILIIIIIIIIILLIITIILKRLQLGGNLARAPRAPESGPAQRQ